MLVIQIDWFGVDQRQRENVPTFYQIIKTFGRMVRGNVQEAPLWSLFLVVKRDCNETPMLGIRIVLSFLFLFVRIGISYGNPWPSSILALVAGWKSGAFRCSDVLLCPMSGRTAAIAEVKAIQRVLLQTRMQCDFFFNNDHSVPYAFFFQGLYVLHYINIILTSVNFSRHDHGYINAYRPKGWIYPPPRMPVTTRIIAFLYSCWAWGAPHIRSCYSSFYLPRRCQEQQPFFSFTDSFQWCSASSQYRGVAHPSAPVDMKKHRIRSELPNKFASE